MILGKRTARLVREAIVLRSSKSFSDLYPTLSKVEPDLPWLPEEAQN